MDHRNSQNKYSRENYWLFVFKYIYICIHIYVCTYTQTHVPSKHVIAAVFRILQQDQHFQTKVNLG